MCYNSNNNNKEEEEEEKVSELKMNPLSLARSLHNP